MRQVALGTFVVASLAFAGMRYLTNMFPVEDAVVYFHRANYTEQPTLFYYAGYISLPAQIVAWACAVLPPLVQGAAYAGVAVALWIALGSYLLRLPNVLAAFLLFAYAAAFFQYAIFSLTYSLWTSVSLFGVVPALRIARDERLTTGDTVLCVVAAHASPLTILFAPAATWLWWRDRPDMRAALVALSAISAGLLLPDPEDAQSDPSVLVGRLHDVARLALADPMGAIGIRGASIHEKVGRAIDWLAVATVTGGTVWFLAAWLRRRSGGAFGIVLCLLGALGILAASFATKLPEDLPLPDRYFFPLVVFSLFLAGLAAGRTLSAQVWPVVAIAVLPAMYVAARSWEDIGASVRGFPAIVARSEETALIRRGGRASPNQWTVAFGDLHFSEADCRPAGELPADLRFQIHCNRERFIYVAGSDD